MFSPHLTTWTMSDVCTKTALFPLSSVSYTENVRDKVDD
jgi:hypothetical protein